MQQLKSSLFYSLLIDESTDVAVLKQLVVVARCILPSGAVETMFLDICDIQDGTASTIEHILLQCLKRYGLDISNLRGFGSDGAAVMVGGGLELQHVSKLGNHVSKLGNHAFLLFTVSTTDLH